MSSLPFTIDLELDVDKCEDCLEQPGAYLFTDRHHFTEAIRVCGYCGSYRVANTGGVLEHNENKADFLHVYKPDLKVVEDENTEGVVTEVHNAFLCANCDQYRTGVPEVKTGYEPIGDPLDGMWTTTEHGVFGGFKEVQYWFCHSEDDDEACFMLLSEQPVPVGRVSVWECDNCGYRYLNKLEAVHCCGQQ